MNFFFALFSKVFFFQSMLFRKSLFVFESLLFSKVSLSFFLNPSFFSKASCFRTCPFLQSVLFWKHPVFSAHLMGSVSNIVHLGELTAASTAPFNFRLKKLGTIFVLNRFCLEPVMSWTGFVWNGLCLEPVLSGIDLIWNWFCLETVLSGTGFV